MMGGMMPEGRGDGKRRVGGGIQYPMFNVQYPISKGQPRTESEPKSLENGPQRREIEFELMNSGIE
jgi:hypothetical protein